MARSKDMCTLSFHTSYSSVLLLCVDTLLAPSLLLFPSVCTAPFSFIFYISLFIFLLKPSSLNDIQKFFAYLRH